MLPLAAASWLSEWSSAIPAWLLMLGACLGHAYFMVIGLNVLYSYPLPHRVLKFTRKIDLAVILAGPVIFGFAMGFPGPRGLEWQGYSLRFFLAPYTVFCFLLGVVVAPFTQVLYWLRRTAPQLVEQQSQVVDVAKELGYWPEGRGKHARLTRLPFNRCFQVEFRRLTLKLPQLPEAWEGLTILHLTDLHLRGTPDRRFYQWVMERALGEGVPDLIALTGDVVDSGWHHRWIVPVLGRLRWSLVAFAILGNHDVWRDVPLIRRRLARLGFDVIGNGWRQIDVRGQPLVVIGHEGPWFKPLADLSACPAGTFRLGLSHSPDAIGWARRHAIDLLLCGHVHGGQIRLPLIGSTFVPSRHSRRFDAGTFFLPPTLMHVSRGLAGQHPLRFNCYPEVTRIVLRRG
jgi:predicted MPP superfamily phosphohydrolase